MGAKRGSAHIHVKCKVRRAILGRFNFVFAQAQRNNRRLQVRKRGEVPILKGISSPARPIGVINLAYKKIIQIYSARYSTWL